MWWKKNPAFFAKEQKRISTSFPSLQFHISQDTVFLSGKLQIVDIASFDIEIKFPDDYPDSLPIVKETGTKIPISNERHINSDGTCCLSVPAIIHKKLSKNYTVIDFIEKYVVPFFANQLHFEIYSSWANGDFSHGSRGIVECYQELLNVQQLKIIVALLKIALQTFPKTNKKCPCDSNKKLKKCHLNMMIDLRISIPHSVLRNDYQILSKYL